MSINDLKIFCGRSNPHLAQRLCDYLGVPQGQIALSNFPDSEISCKIEENVRGRDVFLIQSTCTPVNENLMELMVMIDSCRRASAPMPRPRHCKPRPSGPRHFPSKRGRWRNPNKR